MRIVVVDDSRAARSIVMRLMRQAGWDHATFVEASNGAEALVAIRSCAPELVVADWNMPEMSGIEMLQALRSEGNAVKVGFVTSETSSALWDLAREAGASFLIGKPFTVAALKDVLTEVLP
jgi:two-component system chemotaxis response regulator CheY